jgi:hypothetical protein
VRDGKIRDSSRAQKFRGEKESRRAPSQGTPRVSVEKNQMSQAQLRAKIGAAPTDNEGETDGEILEVPVAAKTQTSVTGTGDKIRFCELAGTAAGSGCGAEVF